MRKAVSIIIICFMIMTVFSGCGLLQKLGLQKSGSDELTPVSSVAMNETDAKTLNDKLPIYLYFANQDNTKLKLEVRYIPMTEAKKSVNNLASTIVKELIKGPAEKGLQATIPKGTKLRSPVSINARVATVDLTGEFIDNHSGGKNEAQMTIYSIVNSLTELKDIEKVKFTINGAVKADFKGFYQFNALFPRTVSLISKEVTPSDGASGKSSGDKNSTDKARESTAKPDTKGNSTDKASTKAKDKPSNSNISNDQTTSGMSEEDYATYLEENDLLE
ncbi:MAG: GerMN domain-containing protein [Bacillota bacterium]|nr:GerMN domain-containing protein [Bacillota bacterium]